MKPEFQAAVEAVSNIDFSTSTDETINIFETTIRYLGGFLSAYDLSGERVLLDKAIEVDEMVLTAFDTPNHMPITRWPRKEAKDRVQPQEAPDRMLISELGSLSLSTPTNVGPDSKCRPNIGCGHHQIRQYDERSRCCRWISKQNFQPTLQSLDEIWCSRWLPDGEHIRGLSKYNSPTIFGWPRDLSHIDFHRTAMDTEAIALDSTNSLSPVAEFNFASLDRGWDWLVLLGNAATDAFVWGVPFTFGVFQEHYAGLSEFKNETSVLPIIGMVTLGLLYLGSPFSILLLNVFPRYPRLFMWIGTTIISLSLILASFATKTSHLILTQGIMYALGGALVSFPGLAMLDQWFLRHKGIAFGISWSSTGLSGLLLPYLISWSLTHYSFRTTLRWLAIAQLLWVAPLILLITPRVPAARTTRFRLPSLRYALKQPFAGLQLSIVVHSLGYFLPSLYLPSYARAIGMSSTAAAASVALLNIGIATGSVVVGFAIDRWSTAKAILVTTIASAAFTVTLWGRASNAGTVFAFALVYGVCSGGATSTWPGIVRDTVREYRWVDPAFAYSLLVASRGVGNLISGPLAGALLRIPPLTEGIRYGIGSQFGGLIVFSAVTAFFGASGVVVAKVSKVL